VYILQYDFFLHLQVDNYIPKHYLPPIIRLCEKLETLDRVLPKLKETDHRVLNFYMFVAGLLHLTSFTYVLT
jgi:hypothetical protein